MPDKQDDHVEGGEKCSMNFSIIKKHMKFVTESNGRALAVSISFFWNQCIALIDDKHLKEKNLYRKDFNLLTK